MNNEILDKAANVLAQSYGGDSAALPPGFLDMLIGIVLDLLENCLNSGNGPVQIKESVDTRLGRIMTQRAVRSYLREKFGVFGYARHGGDKIVQTILDAGSGASETDLQELASIAG